MNLNETLRDAQFKDESPQKTVDKIKSILKDNNISTVEQWHQTGVPYCYALRVSVVGTNFGVNGKGLTSEFALASAYGELMERLQLGWIGTRYAQKDGSYSQRSNGEKMSAKALLEANSIWYDRICEKVFEIVGFKLTSEELLAQFADGEGMLDVTPYFNIVKKKKEFFPTALKRIYGSNGGAAGNTPEEALVQAMSEIIERYVRLRIIEEDLALPDIPDSVIEKYPVAHNIVTFVRKQGYRVLIKDASLDTNYPAVCVVFIHEKSGRYHTHFGAYPNFEIALERALTETFQGRTIDNMAKFEDFCYQKDQAISTANILKELVKGTGEKVADFFFGEPKFAFSENVGFSGANNKELLCECVDFFVKQGYDVLVRDSSCLGFPTYQIIVPGCSEIYLQRLSNKHSDNKYAEFVYKVLRNPSAAKFDDLIGALMHITLQQKLMRDISTSSEFLANSRLAANLDSVEQKRYMAASICFIHYQLGKYSECLTQLKGLISSFDNDCDGYLICVKRYLSMFVNKYSEPDIRKTLIIFHGEDMTNRLFESIAKNSNLFEDYVLHCDLSSCGDCKLNSVCYQKRVSELSDFIAKKTDEIDFDESSSKLIAALG